MIWDIITAVYIALFGLAVTLLGLPGFLKETHLDKYINKPKSKFRVVCLVAGILFLCCATYQYFEGRKSSNQLADMNTEITGLKLDIKGYKLVMDSINKDPADTVTKGVGYSFILTIQQIEEKRNNFILDCGFNENKNRVSLYVDSSNSLVYRVIDNDGQVYSIKTHRNRFTFKKNTNYFIYFDFGYSDNLSFMRMFIDKNMVGEVKIWNNSIHPLIGIDDQCLIGTDVLKQSFGKFLLQYYSKTKVPLTRKEINALSNATAALMEALGR